MRISDWSSDVCSSDLCSAEPPSKWALKTIRAAMPRRPWAAQLKPASVLLAFAAGAGAGRLSSLISASDMNGLLPLIPACIIKQCRHDLGRYYGRSEEHTSELQSLMRISYAVFCLKKKTTKNTTQHHTIQ